MGAHRDPCVVNSEPISVLLRDFVTRWGRERPVTTGRFTGGRSEVSPIGAVAWLAQETALPADTIDNLVRGRNRTCELRTADRIVSALGRPELFHDGTLTIRPNPTAPRDERALCCSGSLTGSFD